MQTLQFHEKVGADGVLRLEVPDLPRGQEVEAVLIVQLASSSQNSQEALDWVDALYGSCSEDPIARPIQGEWPVREELL